MQPNGKQSHAQLEATSEEEKWIRHAAGSFDIDCTDATSACIVAKQSVARDC